MHRVVILHGPPGCGKDTVTKGFVRGGFQHIGVGDGIRSWIANHCPPHKDSIGATKGPEKDISQRALNGRSPRDLQIHIGSLEDFFPTIWTEAVVNSMEAGKCSIIDSVKHNSQLMQLQLALLRRFDDIRLYAIEIVRPGYEWGRLNDTRSPLRVAGDHLILHNDRDPDGLEVAGMVLANHINWDFKLAVHQTTHFIGLSYLDSGEPQMPSFVTEMRVSDPKSVNKPFTS